MLLKIKNHQSFETCRFVAVYNSAKELDNYIFHHNSGNLISYKQNVAVFDCTGKKDLFLKLDQKTCNQTNFLTEESNTNIYYIYFNVLINGKTMWIDSIYFEEL
jgi:hypothetical protein